MKPVAKSRLGIRGTIMIFALIVILGGALVLAAWAQMLATQSVYPDTTAERIKCRVALANGRALARQFLLEQMPLDPSSRSNNFTPNYFLSNSWGGFYLFFSRDNDFWANTNLSAGNPFSTFGGTSFVDTNNTFWLAPYSADTNNREYWAFRVRSRSPLLAGFPLVVHQPASTNLGSWAPTAKIYYTNPIGFMDFPQVPFTSGTNPAGAGTNNYKGYFAAPLSTNYLPQTNNLTGISVINPTNTGYTNSSTNMVGTRTNTTYWSGQLGLLINSSQTDPIIHFDIPSTTNFSTNISTTVMTTYTNARVTNVTLVASANTNAMHLIVPATNANLSSITLSNTPSTREIYLNKQSTNNLILQTATTNASYTWWFAATLSNSNSVLVATNIPRSSYLLTLTGGLRTPGTITNNGNLRLTNDTTPSASIEHIADRVMWLEEARTQ